VCVIERQMTTTPGPRDPNPPVTTDLFLVFRASPTETQWANDRCAENLTRPNNYAADLTFWGRPAEKYADLISPTPGHSYELWYVIADPGLKSGAYLAGLDQETSNWGAALQSLRLTRQTGGFRIGAVTRKSTCQVILVTGLCNPGAAGQTVGDQSSCYFSLSVSQVVARPREPDLEGPGAR
jgi:hypothetical protein